MPQIAGCEACSLGVCTLHMDATPRGTEPAEKKSRSAPATDAASEGGAAPKIPASEASEERPASKAMPSPSMSGGDPPEEEAVNDSSGEKPAAQEEPCDEFVCMLIFHGAMDHLLFLLARGDWVTCGLWAGGEREGGNSSSHGADLSKGGSVDDGGRSAEWPRRCMGHLWIVGGRRVGRRSFVRFRGVCLW